MKDTGSENYGGGVATASGLLLIGATLFDHKLHAFDSKTGKLLWDAELPYSGELDAPHLYGGRQAVCGDRRQRQPRSAWPQRHRLCRLCLG